jgi:uncharacterized protein (TIGR04141 family)
MDMMDAKVQPVTIYLARRGAERAELIDTTNPCQRHSIKINSDLTADLYIQPSERKRPRWVSFFDGHVAPEQFGKNSSTGAALVITVDNKHFALTFGRGGSLLSSTGWEDRFGLRVVLNCIGDEKVRSLEKHSLDQLLRHTTEQASRDATAGEFGLDIEQDLLRAVTGTPASADYGKRISGGEALHLALPLSLTELPTLLDNLHDRFCDTAYQKQFAWVDHISELNDMPLEEELNAVLATTIASGERSNIWMAVPVSVPWEKIKGFRFPSTKINAEYEDIHLDHFVTAMGGASSITTDLLTSRNVICLNHDDKEMCKWNAFRCLYAEIDCKGESFLLSGAKWYRVDPNFVHETDTAFEQIPNCEAAFPEFNDKSEGAYLERLASSNQGHFALMDQKNIPYGGGHSKVEFCDLLSSENDLFHVKRYGQASALSHLFAQGLVSGELFLTDEGFRKEVNARLPQSHQFDSDVAPERGEYRVVFGIISDRPGPLRVPFFSRLNMKHAARRLGAYGYRVAKMKIPVSEAISKKTTLRTRRRKC